MPYLVSFTGDMQEELGKLHKRDKALYRRIEKKVNELKENPKMGKPMRTALKGSWRVHIRHFVLMYTIDDIKNIVEFYKIENHNKAY